MDTQLRFSIDMHSLGPLLCRAISRRVRQLRATDSPFRQKPGRCFPEDEALRDRADLSCADDAEIGLRPFISAKLEACSLISGEEGTHVR